LIDAEVVLLLMNMENKNWSIHE